jgi:hypothetical protein
MALRRNESRAPDWKQAPDMDAGRRSAPSGSCGRSVRQAEAHRGLPAKGAQIAGGIGDCRRIRAKTITLRGNAGAIWIRTG